MSSLTLRQSSQSCGRYSATSSTSLPTSKSLRARQLNRREEDEEKERGKEGGREQIRERGEWEGGSV